MICKLHSQLIVVFIFIISTISFSQFVSLASADGYILPFSNRVFSDIDLSQITSYTAFENVKDQILINATVQLINGYKSNGFLWKIEGIIDMSTVVNLADNSLDMNKLLEEKLYYNDLEGAMNETSVYNPVGFSGLLHTEPSFLTINSKAYYELFSTNGSLLNIDKTQVTATKTHTADIEVICNYLNALSGDGGFLYPINPHREMTLIPQPHTLNNDVMITDTLYLNIGAEQNIVFIIEINNALEK